MEWVSSSLWSFRSASGFTREKYLWADGTGQELSWTLHLNSVSSGMLDSTRCHPFLPAPWHRALSGWTVCIFLCTTFWILSPFCSWLSLFSTLPASFIKSLVSLSLCQCPCPSLSWNSVVLTADLHALLHSMSLLGKMSSFLRTSLGGNGSCLSLSFKILIFRPFCLKKRGRILVSLGIKLFLLIAIPWGAACEEVQGFFRHMTVLTLLSFVIIGKCQLEAILQVFSQLFSLSNFLLKF